MGCPGLRPTDRAAIELDTGLRFWPRVGDRVIVWHGGHHAPPLRGILVNALIKRDWDQGDPSFDLLIADVLLDGGDMLLREAYHLHDIELEEEFDHSPAE